MKHFILFIVGLSLSFVTFAQPSEVTLVVTGEGTTKEEATNLALRSAVEQAFGVFVSANTDILNDEIVNEEIATITSGNVQSFRELAYVDTPSSSKMITLEVTVSIGNLIQYAQSYGAITELAGATIAANINLIELNYKATGIALCNMYNQVEQMIPYMYNYSITSTNPTIEGMDVILNLEIAVNANENTSKIGKYIYSTLQALSHTREEVSSSLDMGYNMGVLILKYFEGKDLKSRKIELPWSGAPFFQVKEWSAKQESQNLVFLYIPLKEQLAPIEQLLAVPFTNLSIVDNTTAQHNIEIDKCTHYRQGKWYPAFFLYKSQGGQFTSGSIGAYCNIPTPIIGFYDYDSYHSKLDPIKVLRLPKNSQLLGAFANRDYKEGDLVCKLNGRIIVSRQEINSINALKVHPIINH